MIMTLKPVEYNKDLFDICKKLRGKWNDEKKEWRLSSINEKYINVLDIKYKSVKHKVRITFGTTGAHQALRKAYFIGGFEVATAVSRKSDVKMTSRIELIKGGACGIGTIIDFYTFIRPNTVIEMLLPELIIDEVIEKGRGIYKLEII